MNRPTSEQLRQVGEQIAPMMRYLRRLLARLEARGMLNTKVYDDARLAYDRVYALSVSVHYGSCDSGVAKPSSMRIGPA